MGREVLVYIKTLNTTNPAQQMPTTEQVASSVTSSVDYQLENLGATALQVISLIALIVELRNKISCQDGSD